MFHTESHYLQFLMINKKTNNINELIISVSGNFQQRNRVLMNLFIWILSLAEM